MDASYKLGLRLNAVAVLLLFGFLVAMRYYIARVERARAARLEDEALMGREAHV